VVVVVDACMCKGLYVSMQDRAPIYMDRRGGGESNDLDFSFLLVHLQNRSCTSNSNAIKLSTDHTSYLS
jgi:hypothetical protein